MENKWTINKQVNLSMIVQIILLAGLIIGTWVNLQRQLSIMARDIEIILQTQRQFREKLENVNSMCIGFEYRMRAVENQKDKKM